MLVIAMSKLLLVFYLLVVQRPIEGPSGANQDLRSFKLILEYIKALPVSMTDLLKKKNTQQCFLLHL